MSVKSVVLSEDQIDAMIEDLLRTTRDYMNNHECRCKSHCTEESTNENVSATYDTNMYTNINNVAPDKTPSRKVIGSDIFEAAKWIVNGHRQEDYGAPEDSFQNIANYWNAYFKQVADKREDGLTAEDIAIMMILFKIARLGHGYTKDSVIDICGYAAIYAAMHGD